MLTHIELFAGISGFGLGFERAGIKTIARVEIDKFSQRILKKHYPDDLLQSDVKLVGEHNLPFCDILTMGSPCQDLSNAGLKRGLAGSKSSLFSEGIRVISQLKPNLVIWENVEGAFSSNSGRDFATVLHQIRQCGASEIGWRTLNAEHFGIPQSRKRIFLVADFSDRQGRVNEILFSRRSDLSSDSDSDSEGQGTVDTTGIRAYHVTFCDARGRRADRANGGCYITEATTSHTLTTKTPGWQTVIVSERGVRRLTPVECERLMGFPDGWTGGVSDTQRYKMLGNSVAVPITEDLGFRIVKHWNHSNC